MHFFGENAFTSTLLYFYWGPDVFLCYKTEAIMQNGALQWGPWLCKWKVLPREKSRSFEVKGLTSINNLRKGGESRVGERWWEKTGLMRGDGWWWFVQYQRDNCRALWNEQKWQCHSLKTITLQINNLCPLSAVCCHHGNYSKSFRQTESMVAERQVPQHSVPVLLLLQLPERGASFDLMAMREGLFSVSYVNS